MFRHVRSFTPFALTAFIAATPVAAEPQSFEMPRADGSVIHWKLDISDSDGKSGLIVIAQGSGCAAAMQSPNLKHARSAFGNLAALTVEKYGVKPGDNPSDDHMDCSQAFREHHTLSQRVADYRQIIDSLRGAAWWNGKLFLFGGSEGGIVMAMLAPEVRAEAAILISTGGGVPFGQMVRQSIPEEGWPTVDATFEKARQNPDSTELWAGQSLRFWADAIHRRAADYMLRADTGFLLIQGGRDGSGAANVARAVSDLFAKEGRCNLTYWEFPAFDHGMVDAGGNAHLAEVLSQASLWLNARMDANIDSLHNAVAERHDPIISEGATMEHDIRLATPADLTAIETIVQSAYSHYVERIGRKPGPMLDDYLSLILNSRVYMAAKQGVIGGILVLIPKDDAILLDNVAVAPEAQGQGLGRKLLMFAEQQAAEAGFRLIRLYTNEAMTENIDLYKRIGYRETHRAEEHGLRRVYMEKAV